MSAASLRRLAADHASLHTSALPPHYLFPPTSASSSIPDDLTQLDILLTGPHGTPYSQGLWKLHLKIPEDYPRSPPKASFRTRIWHPNVEESTGSVCVDTLKRDWEPKLTIRDVLVVISCLLIQPNPDSALNAAAGQLLQEDFEEFAKQAKLMTSIHAPIPSDLKEMVLEAKRRGEESDVNIPEEKEEKRTTGTHRVTSSVVMKKRPQPSQHQSKAMASGDSTATAFSNTGSQSAQESDDEDDDSEESASKENDPSLSASPVVQPPPSPRKHVLGKRPLSDLPTPVDPDEIDEDGLSSSERNVANNFSDKPSASNAPTGPRKSPKLSERCTDLNTGGADGSFIKPYEDEEEYRDHPPTNSGKEKASVVTEEGKENTLAGTGSRTQPKPTLVQKKTLSATSAAGRSSATGRNFSTGSGASTGSGKSGKPRVGLRRL